MLTAGGTCSYNWALNG